MGEGRASPLLLVALDLNPFSWLGDGEGETDILTSMVVFLKAYLCTSATASLAIVCHGVKSSRFIFPTEEDDVGRVEQYIREEDMQTIMMRLVAFYEEEWQGLDEIKANYNYLDAATSLLVCYARKVMSQATKETRMLLVTKSRDNAAQYVPFMNVVFACQKLSILIDALVLSPESTFLQQAVHLTGGTYRKVKETSHCTQELMAHFLSPPSIRKQLNHPRLTHVDYRSTCFCHHRLLDDGIGYVCSVCLSIFCQPVSQCSTCKNVVYPDTPQ